MTPRIWQKFWRMEKCGNAHARPEDVMCSGGGQYSSVIDHDALARYHAMMMREDEHKRETQELLARARAAREEKARPVTKKGR